MSSESHLKFLDRSQSESTRWALLALIPLFALAVGTGARAQSGEFTVLSYNVAGLPPLVGACCDPANSIPEMATRILPASYDIVGFQEAFTHGLGAPQGAFTAYYDALMGPSTPAGYSFSPSDPVAGFVVGSGLGRLSTFAFDSSGGLLPCEDPSNDPLKFCRQKWDDQEGQAEALSDKGYSYARHEISSGVFVDVYNMHAQAGGGTLEAAARAANHAQFITEFNTRSEGNAAVVMGDVNATYDRTADVIRDFLTDTTGDSENDDPLVDVWVELTRSGVLPTQGGTPLFSCDEVDAGPELPRDDWGTSACEWRDKIFYRSSDQLTLTATEYFVEIEFLNSSMEEHSDHYPTGATFSYQVVPEPAGAGLAALVTLALMARCRGRRSP